MDLIKTEDMKKNYGNTEVLKKINLSVHEGIKRQQEYDGKNLDLFFRNSF